nr:MAG TPA: hypothetical protein [Caudoviricetes sp.]
MFQSLRPNSQIFILHKDGRPVLETGSVVSVYWRYVSEFKT